LVGSIATQTPPPIWFDGLLVLLAVGTAVYTALLFAQAKARDFWQSPLLGVHMLIHAILAGAGVFALFANLLPDTTSGWAGFVRWTAVGALLAKLAVDWLELGTTHATADAARSAHEITRGRYARWYWLAVILAGVVAPLVLLVVGAWTLPIAGVLILFGIYVAEHIWVRAPQEIPLA
jgi:formate-dependent nitrite reductase membrane component NrfD